MDSEKGNGNENVINANPTKELFIYMLTRDLSLRDAIGDLLDNCVDGALRLHSDKNYEGLFVNIEFDHEKDYFQISDNCGGISVENARNYAFRFGRPEEAEESLGSVGYFGIGMKRALFKLGGKFRVESKAENSSFVVEENVSEWAKDKDSNWRFNFEESETGIVVPENERGTTITVTSLHEDVKNAFALSNETGDLREELRLEHLLNIDRGLKITVNGKELKSHALKLLASDQIKTASLKIPSPETLGIEIYAGISEIGEGEKRGREGGWYLFCNDRLVLGPDQTQTTGWGARKPLRIPEYHNQFYRFRGYVFMEAENPSFLPWNTAKNGMDEDSPTYKGIKQQMVTIMHPVKNFLDDVHRENVDLGNGLIEEAPLQDAIENAKLVNLSEIRKNGRYTASQFIGPKREDIPPKPDIAWIRYSKPTEEFERAKECLGVEKPGEVGERTFDYFMARECEEE